MESVHLFTFFSGEILSSEAPNTPSGSCDRYDTVDLRFGSFSSIPLLFSFFLSFAWSKCHFSNHSTVYFPFILAMINQHHYTINSTWIVNHSTLRYTFFIYSVFLRKRLTFNLLQPHACPLCCITNVTGKKKNELVSAFRRIYYLNLFSSSSNTHENFSRDYKRQHVRSIENILWNATQR